MCSPKDTLRRIITSAALLVVLIYRNTFGTMLLGSCNFAPSCSLFAQKAILKHGPINGIKLALLRVLRCHPFSGQWGFDPVP